MLFHSKDKKEAGSITAACSLKNGLINIIPVRYALDSFVEREKGSAPTAAMPLSESKDWQPRFTGLKTRDYTLRQLRNGWVYVYKHPEPDEAKKLIEYQFIDGLFYQVERQSGQDACEPAYVLAGQPVLQFGREDHLEISYSEVQWSWDHCQQVCSEAVFRKSCMETLNLKEFCQKTAARHATMGEHFAHALSDITPVHGEDYIPDTENLRLRNYRRWRAKNDWRKEIHFDQLEQELDQILVQLRK